MSQKSLHLRLGVVASLFALFLVFFAIPNFVFAPSNVGKLVLSPKFWPYVLSGLTALIGMGLIFNALTTASDVPFEDEETVFPEGSTPWMRLGALAVIMVLVMFGLPRLGMVWTAMLAFAACAFLFRTRHPIAALVCAVIVPLLLYVFFAHVAGVAIPQGNFVRLP